MATRSRAAAKRSRSTPATTATQVDPSVDQTRPGNPDEAPAHETLRTEQLADDVANDGPADAREYFARANRPPHAPALISDVIHLLEDFDIIPRAKSEGE